MTIRLTCTLFLALAASASGKTIILTDADCERMAFIQAGAPRWSWGGFDLTTSSQSTSQFYMYNDRAFLI